MDFRDTEALNDLELMLLDETAEPKALPLSLLEYITNDFSADQEIGRGGFAVVYKCQMDAHYALAEDQASSNNNNANQFLVRDKFVEAEVLKRIIKSHDERNKILQKDAKELMEERDEVLETKANLIHDLLQVKDQKKKLEMDVNHLEPRVVRCGL